MSGGYGATTPASNAVTQFLLQVQQVAEDDGLKCRIGATSTQQCNLHNLDIQNCTNVDVQCCNETSIDVLECKSAEQLLTSAVSAVLHQTTNNPQVEAYTRSILTQTEDLNPDEAFATGLQNYFTRTCNAFVHVDQMVNIPTLRAINCSDVAVRMYNQSDVAIRCAASAISHILPAVPDDGPTPSPPPPPPAPTSNPFALNVTTTYVLYGMLAVSVILIVEAIVGGTTGGGRKSAPTATAVPHK